MWEWFNILTSSEQIFWIIAVLSTIIFFFVLIAGFLIGKFNQSIQKSRFGIQFFTFRNCIAFFSLFGWVGIACLYQNYNLTTSIIIAFLGGIVMMFVMAGLFYYVHKMADSGGTVEFKNEINTTGEVLISVGRKRSAIGKVQIKLQGILKQMDALTDFEHDIVKGTLIEIESVNEDGILIIKPLQ